MWHHAYPFLALLLVFLAAFVAAFYLDERAQLFETKYLQFLSEIQEQANDQELNGGTQQILPAYQYGDY